MKKVSVIVFGFLMFWSTTAVALPILNTDQDYLKDGQTLFGPYTNSGDLVGGVQSGNNSGSPSNLTALESFVEDSLGYDSSFTLNVTGYIEYTNYMFDSDNNIVEAGSASNTGTWAVDTSMIDAISFYAVKAGNFFAMYLVDPADATGSWSTYDIWRYGIENDLPGAGGNDGLEISHFTGYNPAAPVPEPATMTLLGVGLIGIAGLGRRKFKK